MEDMLDVAGMSCAHWYWRLFCAHIVTLHVIPGDAAADLFSNVVQSSYALGGGNALHAICALRFVFFVLVDFTSLSLFALCRSHFARSSYSIHVSKIIIGHLNSGSNKTVRGVISFPLFICVSLTDFFRALKTRLKFPKRKPRLVPCLVLVNR